MRLALGLAYDGGGFHGVAAQPGCRTVAGVLAEQLSLVLRLHERPRCTVAGRTDAGVHAIGQVVHVDVPGESLDTWRRRRGHDDDSGGLRRLAGTLSELCGPEIAVWQAVPVPASFDARRSATARRYRYDLLPGGRRDPLRARIAWQLDGAFDLAAMRLACDPLVGEHDFAAFCRHPPDQRDGPIVRRVLEARWSVLSGPGVDDPLWRFEIEAPAFCQQMVRSIVGLHVAIGQGRGRPSDLAERLASGSRTGNPAVAPPQGLCLVGVSYPEPFAALLDRRRDGWCS